MRRLFRSGRADVSRGPGKEESVRERGNTGKDPATDQAKNRIKFDLLIHDLKVPLSVIEAGVTSLLKRADKYGPLTEKQEKVLTRIIRNTKVTQALVSDALELSRSSQGKLMPGRVVLSSLIEQALTEVFDLVHCRTAEKIKACSDLTRLRERLAQQGLVLSVEHSIWTREISMDEAKVKQILRNLLNNALKYRKSRVELEVKEEDGNLVFSVTDDGEGIPSVYHTKIFESYFQMEPGEVGSVRGHGLGLAGVMALVEDMGGELCLESDEGRGATFLVRLPAAL